MSRQLTVEIDEFVSLCIFEDFKTLHSLPKVIMVHLPYPIIVGEAHSYCDGMI
jgi:hypothetical protein